jgi:hypothetical protein
MKTASFFTYQGPGRISIARFAPRGTPAGFRIFKDLAPGSWFNSVTPARYVELYAEEILSQMDPKETWDTLHEMAAGAEPVLLCWEKPTDKDAWCHRRLAANWFAKQLGEVIPELGFEGVEVQPLMPPIQAPKAKSRPQAALFGEH